MQNGLLKNYGKTISKGLIVGGTMLVPGVSGGSMAMILGIYDHLIMAVSSFFKSKRKNFFFLLAFSLGGLLGILLFAKPLSLLLNRFPMAMMYFFMGAVVGSVPMMVKKTKTKEFSIRYPVYVIFGFITVILLGMLPITGVDGADGGLALFLGMILAGFIAAVALVLPGISVSYMLLMLGLYDTTIEAITTFNLAFLFPLGLGLVLGIVLTTKLLEKALYVHPKPTYYIILGFILGSLVEIFPGVPTGIDFFSCVVTFCAGTASIYALTALEKGE